MSTGHLSFVCGCCEIQHPGNGQVDKEEYARCFPDHPESDATPLCDDCYAYLRAKPYEQPEFVHLVRFVAESNRIEGIHREPHMREVVATWTFLREPVSLASLVKLVSWLQPEAVLRVREGCNVYVGNHVPPPGGPGVRKALEALLVAPYGRAKRHHAYETLHPFTDGNGRSGRALWLHDRGGVTPLGFLHHWYYDSLEFLRPAGDYEAR